MAFISWRSARTSSARVRNIRNFRSAICSFSALPFDFAFTLRTFTEAGGAFFHLVPRLPVWLALFRFAGDNFADDALPLSLAEFTEDIARGSLLWSAVFSMLSGLAFAVKGDLRKAVAFSNGRLPLCLLLSTSAGLPLLAGLDAFSLPQTMSILKRCSRLLRTSGPKSSRMGKY